MNYCEFYAGRCYDAYDYLGCHILKNMTIFRTYAPEAVKVCLIGEFNDWQEIPMKRIYDGKFFEYEINENLAGNLYKYRVYQKNGRFIDHCDPYGFSMEKPPMCASMVCDFNQYVWADKQWIQSRNCCLDRPLNIYEVHLGSWKKNNGEWYNYKDIAPDLIDYVKNQGFNYIEVMPLGEHPCDSSWGYQQTGFYSPTARYGKADDLKYLINYAHIHNVGVILDFVPVHFAVDDYALTQYDGTCIYEYPHHDVGYSEWGSKNFNHARGEVQSFLISLAHYWIQEFHFDGLRFDAISNMIYWQGDKERGVNTSAVNFIKALNKSVKTKYPNILLIAEDSTQYAGATKKVEDGGLGFDYKWDMGWMHDTLDYFALPFQQRIEHYHKITFSMMYFYNEHHLLAFSRDEVVHGKKTIIDKIYGSYEEKFAQAKLLYLYMYTYPGKKLNFMGNEIAHFREWDEQREQDWNLLNYDMHKDFQHYFSSLNHLYLSTSAFYRYDYQRSGFQWIDCNLEKQCIYAYLRKNDKKTYLVVLNTSNKEQKYQTTIKHNSIKVVLSTIKDKQIQPISVSDTLSYTLDVFEGIVLELL